MTLKEMRKAKGLTQDKLANKLNVSRSAISLWECGKTQPDFNTLKQLSKIFDVSIDELLGNNPITYDKLTDLETELIQLCRSMPKNKVKEGMNYMRYISNK